MSDYETLKEILRAAPADLNRSEIVYLFWTCLEVIEAQERLIREFEHHIDNVYTSDEVKRSCERRYYSTSRLMGS